MGNASMLYIDIDKLIFTSIYHLNRLFTKKQYPGLKVHAFKGAFARANLVSVGKKVWP